MNDRISYLTHENEMLVSMIKENKRKEKLKLVYVIGFFAIAYLISSWLYAKSIKKLDLENQTVMKHNIQLMDQFNEELKQVKLLRQAGWKDEKIDEFVSNGCLMYFEIGGNMK